MGFAFACAAALALIPSDQPTLFRIELFFRFDFPLVKSGATQVPAFEFFPRLGDDKFNDITHHDTVAY